MKKLLILAAALLTAATAAAQTGIEAGSSADLPNKLYIGPKAGAVLTTMTQPEQCDLYDKSGFGFDAGVTVRARFGRGFDGLSGTGIIGVGVDLLYKMNTVKTLGTDESGKAGAKFTMNYFEAPVYVQLFPFAKADAGFAHDLYIELGCSFAGTMSRKPESLTVEPEKGDYDRVTYNIDNSKSKLKGMDVRGIVGLGWQTKNFSLSTRYYLSTSKLADNLDSKMNSFEVAVAFPFSIGSF